MKIEVNIFKLVLNLKIFLRRQIKIKEKIMEENINTQNLTNPQKIVKGVRLNWPIIIILVAINILLLVGAFYLGMQYGGQKAKLNKQAVLPSPTFKPTKSLEFKKTSDIFSISKERFPDLPQELKDKKDQAWKAIYCLNFEETERPKNFESVSADIKENELITGLQEIGNYEYSDEQVIQNMDGTKTVENQGKKSKKGILYESICKDEQNYYVVFTTTEPNLFKKQSLFRIGNVYAAGGMYWGPANFAIVEKSGKTTILENLNKISQKIALTEIEYDKSNYPKGYVMVKENFLPYYGCRDVVGVLGNQVYITCGGGDGPGAGRGIFQINLDTKLVKEVAFCSNIFPQEYNFKKESCYDGEGNLYFQKDY